LPASACHRPRASSFGRRGWRAALALLLLAGPAPAQATEAQATEAQATEAQATEDRAAEGQATEDRAAERARMIEVIQAHARGTAELLGRPRIDPEVIAVMAATERHRFVPERVQGAAYEDRPLPIGWSQTISQPFIVALMTDLLALEPGDRVLEVGTGSGYQAAVLAPLAAEVCSIEIVPELGARAAALLQALGLANVRARIGDGYYGWPECGPFDAIVVTAAASHVPPPLVEQLKPGGRLVIPVGGPFVVQHLMLVDKLPDGGLRSRQTIPVSFVPLVGG